MTDYTFSLYGKTFTVDPTAGAKHAELLSEVNRLEANRAEIARDRENLLTVTPTTHPN